MIVLLYFLFLMCIILLFNLCFLSLHCLLLNAKFQISSVSYPRTPLVSLFALVESDHPQTKPKYVGFFVDDESLGFKKSQRIFNREDDYRRRRLNQVISPERHDAFANGDKTPKPETRTYADVMREAALKKGERGDIEGWINLKIIQIQRKQRQVPIGIFQTRLLEFRVESVVPLLHSPEKKQMGSRWDETPGSATPTVAYMPGVTPVGGVELATPTPGAINLRGAITPEQYNLLRWEKDIEDRNRPLTDEDLDTMFPQEGYKVLEPPPSYVPIIITPARKLIATPTPLGTPLYSIPEENRGQQFDVPKEMPGGLPFMKPEDYQYFGASDIDARLEELLIDGILYAYQEETSDDANVMLNGFGAVVNVLGQQVKPYLPQICGTIKWRLNNKSTKVRQQAADLISRIAIVMKQCQEEQVMGISDNRERYRNEENDHPNKRLTPAFNPYLEKPTKKVQENCIDLVGRIADCGAEYVSTREWMRTCFELLEMLKAHKEGIRRATVNTFGYIAKAIVPQEVLATLLNNLKVQERKNRGCTTVAIAIVAETCLHLRFYPVDERVPCSGTERPKRRFEIAFVFVRIHR
ncbi:hypothetical protein L1887_10161 [Cichorium endivia]|nr:hypothetical protein L1887_10161 [Cichorium endivia]